MNSYSADIVNIFISHKHEDEKVARIIKQKLSLFGANRLKFFLFEEIPPGTDWFKWIKDRLAESNLLILLFTHPTSTWDWCLFETGIFLGLAGEDYRRVICLHNPNSEPPSQLKHLQTVKAVPEKVKEFLRLLFGSTKITGIGSPINTAFAEDDGEPTRVAQAICEMFDQRQPRRQFYNNYLILHVDPAHIHGNKLPNDAIIQSDQLSLEMFGLKENPPSRFTWTWNDLENRVLSSGMTKWIEELGEAIYTACQGYSIGLINSTDTVGQPYF
jgi:hypothetical protein